MPRGAVASTPAEVRRAVLAFVDARGNTRETARALGWDLKKVNHCLRHKLGQELLVEHLASLQEQYRVDAQRVVGETAAVAFSDLPALLREAGTIEQLAAQPPHIRAAVMEVQVDADGRIEKLKMHPKLQALNALATYLRLAGTGDPSGHFEDRSSLGGLTLIGPGGEDHAQALPRPARAAE